MQSLQSTTDRYDGPPRTGVSDVAPGSVSKLHVVETDAVHLVAEQTRLAYQQTGIALTVNALVAAALTGTLWVELPVGLLLAWILATGLMTVGGAQLHRLYKQAKPGPGNTLVWRNRLTWSATLSALIWSLASLVMLDRLETGHQALLAIVLAGMAAGAVPAFASILRACVIYVCVLILPIAAWFLLEGSDISFVFGVMSIVFTAAMVLLARNVERSVTNALRFAQENGHLVERLSQAHSMAENASQILETQIAEREQAETAVRDSELRFRDFAELGADLFWEVDTELRYVRVLGHCEEVLGVSAVALIGELSADLGSTQSAQTDKREAHLAQIAARKSFSNYEYIATKPDGEEVVLSSSGRPTYSTDGIYLGYRGVARNVTEEHNLSEKLLYQATHDALTGLYNRRELERRLARVVEAASTEGSENALCFLDLDQFKVVNDTCGHSAGDELLRQLADLLREQVRSRDTLARLGGDEFALLLEHCSIDQAQRVVSGLREAVAEFKFESQGRAFHLGASIGVVPIVNDSGDLKQVMSDADSACYAAKDAGRNRIYVCRKGDELLRKRHSEMQWVSRITQALDDDQFCLYVQSIAPIKPPVRVRDSVQLLMLEPGEELPSPPPPGHTHFEVLVRMLDDQGATIPPGAFLPAAEQFNISPKLDRWVVRSTFEWLTNHPARLDEVELCSINLSGNSLGDEDFGQFVIDQLERTRIPASKVCFEITETAAIARIAAARRLIDDLKALGFKFALDDFGSGLSSFGYLKSLPVDYLKIDGLFIRDIVEDPINLAMVKSINEIGQVMGKKTVAEFVEDDLTLAKLRELGVDFAQGYGIGKPIPIDDIA